MARSKLLNTKIKNENNYIDKNCEQLFNEEFIKKSNENLNNYDLDYKKFEYLNNLNITPAFLNSKQSLNKQLVNSIEKKLTNCKINSNVNNNINIDNISINLKIQKDKLDFLNDNSNKFFTSDYFCKKNSKLDSENKSNLKIIEINESAKNINPDKKNDGSKYFSNRFFHKKAVQKNSENKIDLNADEYLKEDKLNNLSDMKDKKNLDNLSELNENYSNVVTKKIEDINKKFLKKRSNTESNLYSKKYFLRKSTKLKNLPIDENKELLITNYNDENSSFSGYLNEVNVKNFWFFTYLSFKEKYCFIQDENLVLKNSEDSQISSVIKLKNFECSPFKLAKGSKITENLFALYYTTKKTPNSIVDFTYTFTANNKEDMFKWIENLQKAIKDARSNRKNHKKKKNIKIEKIEKIDESLNCLKDIESLVVVTKDRPKGPKGRRLPNKRVSNCIKMTNDEKLKTSTENLLDQNFNSKDIPIIDSNKIIIENEENKSKNNYKIRANSMSILDDDFSILNLSNKIIINNTIYNDENQVTKESNHELTNQNNLNENYNNCLKPIEINQIIHKKCKSMVSLYHEKKKDCSELDLNSALMLEFKNNLIAQKKNDKLSEIIQS